MATQVLLASEPRGDIQDNNFKFERTEVPTLKEDGILVQTLYLSVDPFMRPKMELEKSYTSKYQVGKPLYGDGIGRVIQAKNVSFKEGDLVTSSHFLWKEVAVYTTRECQEFGFHTIDPMGLPLVESLYTLGMTGMTAWIGMQCILQPKAGSTVLVSGAAGAVGGLVGQIARIRGCQVVGLAGSQQKCQMLTKDLGFNKAICYKDCDLEKVLEKEFPKGIDYFWDNCGGRILDSVLPNMADFGKILECGSISAYNNPEPVRNYFNITTKRLTCQGFIVLDHPDKYAQARQEMSEWYKQGKIKSKVTVSEGIDRAVESLKGLFCGKNVGKMLVQICDESKGYNKQGK